MHSNLPDEWRICLPFLPLSVNRLYTIAINRHTGKVKKVLTAEARRERKDIRLITALSGFCVEDGYEYVVHCLFTRPVKRGDADNYLKQLFDSVFGRESDKEIAEFHVKRDTVPGVRQTDMTIRAVPKEGQHA